MASSIHVQKVQARLDAKHGKIKGLVHRKRDILEVGRRKWERMYVRSSNCTQTVSSLSGEGGSPSEGEESRPTS